MTHIKRCCDENHPVVQALGARVGVKLKRREDIQLRYLLIVCLGVMQEVNDSYHDIIPSHHNHIVLCHMTSYCITSHHCDHDDIDSLDDIISASRLDHRCHRQ